MSLALQLDLFDICDIHRLHFALRLDVLIQTGNCFELGSLRLRFRIRLFPLHLLLRQVQNIQINGLQTLCLTLHTLLQLELHVFDVGLGDLVCFQLLIQGPDAVLRPEHVQHQFFCLSR